MSMTWILLTLVASAAAVIHLFYGASWLPCAEYLQIICLGTIFSPLIRVNLSYLMVKGRTDLILKREIAVVVVNLIWIVCAISINVVAVCWAVAIATACNFIITVLLSIRVSGMSFLKQMSDFAPYLAMATVANIPAFTLSYCGIPYYVTAFAGPSISFALYITFLHLRKDDAYIMMRDTAWNSAPIRKLRSRFSK